MFSLTPKLIEKDEVNGLYLVTHVEKNEFSYKYEVKGVGVSYELTSKEVIDLFSVVKLKGELKSFDKNTLPNGFNTYEYKLSRGIKKYIDNTETIVVTKGIKISHDNYFIKVLNDEPILNIGDFSYLFKLNSMMILVFILLIKKVLYYLDIDEEKKNGFIIILLTIMYLLGKNFIVKYYLIKTIVTYTSNLLHIDLNRYDKSSIIMLTLLILNPFVIYSDSFKIIMLLNYIYPLFNEENYDTLDIIFLLIPFQIKYSFGLMLLYFFVPIFRKLGKYVIILLMIFTLLLPFISTIKIVEAYLTILFMYIEKINLFIPVKQFSLTKTIIYYLIVLLIIYLFKRHKIVKYTSFLLILLVIPLQAKRQDQVAFIDVKQGDGAVIYKNNEVIVVDAYYNVYEFLKHEGIRVIDHLILTHNDMDHMGEYELLLKEFEIKKLYLSGYLDYEIDFKHTTYLTNQTLHEIKEIELIFLGPFIDLNNKNENSIVFTIRVNGLKYLFTGDLGYEGEIHYLNKYKEALTSDVLKVGHHGSITSTSLVFLNMVRPSYAVISVKENNQFGFPSSIVLNHLESLGIKIYQTSKDGTIIYKNNEIINFTP